MEDVCVLLDQGLLDFAIIAHYTPELNEYSLHSFNYNWLFIILFNVFFHLIHQRNSDRKSAQNPNCIVQDFMRFKKAFLIN